MSEYFYHVCATQSSGPTSSSLKTSIRKSTIIVSGSHALTTIYSPVPAHVGNYSDKWGVRSYAIATFIASYHGVRERWKVVDSDGGGLGGLCTREEGTRERPG